MKYIEVIAGQGSADTIEAIAEKARAEDFRLGVMGEDGQQAMRMLVMDDQVQTALDALQTVLGAQPSARVMVLNVEVSLPVSDGDAGRPGPGMTRKRPAVPCAIMCLAGCCP